MAAPYPKPKEQRRNRTVPHRGEWVDLEPFEGPSLLREYDPAWQWMTVVDKDGEAHQVRAGVRPAMWEAWRRSPVTTQYGVEDIAAIEELAQRFYLLSEPSRLRLMDALGLTPKGKRDLRWR